jgi:hypothetical protein
MFSKTLKNNWLWQAAFCFVSDFFQCTVLHGTKTLLNEVFIKQFAA